MAYVPPHKRAAVAAAADSELVAVTRSLAELGCSIKSDRASHEQQLEGNAHSDVDRDKHLRILCWEALKKDSPEQLFKAIDEGVATFGIDAPELMVKLENLLWKNSKWHGRSNGEGEDDPPRGLIAVAAGNQAGVPPPGAIKCLAALLRRFPIDYSSDQHAWAMRIADRKGRLWVLALLRAWKSEPMPLQFPFPNEFALGLVGLEELVHRNYRQILCGYDRSAVGAE
uniref:Uncharacterized protein n=1 Tax=Coccolithus braarudii TaxID=221442 RepID=A0A7S0Q0Y8_9EUKA|mmetsp:Transcript_35636/g.76086  ORF Transcript_35636/g.76086 Transcript_35636/m.76086 type:complete len:227 (+) Transcript_35636:38-718(+)|eukprot:CAMPEP_0183351830 /NCGR_PEP_ID=MMETSP0164_2-20130417/26279_1 /TAXON_ID=221442 /ORGANISM="Coccolithus pelagicus ssp braarudi, Strain PLY182g" /LENGTH=226 /DNA_ID=CAMNT_0025524113 /DNA_START=39 /DNA_END=719 /DNA_ORIENTATION=-